MQPILVGRSRHAAAVSRTLAVALRSRGVPCAHSLALETVARMFGHRDWHALLAASKGHAQTPPDDGVDVAEASARRERQAHVLRERFGLPPAVAYAIVDEVRPTGRRRPAEPAPISCPALDAAILGGARLHAFLSGGGLRVVRLELRGRLVGYGEAPRFGEALAHAEEDAHAGGRPYNEVYGKLRPHFMTGSPERGDELDAWILCGHKLDARRGKGGVRCVMSALRTYTVEDAVFERVLADGNPVEWEARGMRYRASKSRNMADAVTYGCIDPGDGSLDPHMENVRRVGRGGGLAAAMADALAAPEVEVVPPCRVRPVARVEAAP